jgi:hypothetical protein
MKLRKLRVSTSKPDLMASGTKLIGSLWSLLHWRSRNLGQEGFTHHNGWDGLHYDNIGSRVKNVNSAANILYLTIWNLSKELWEEFRRILLPLLVIFAVAISLVILLLAQRHARHLQ